jgi:hypothetical protein
VLVGRGRRAVEVYSQRSSVHHIGAVIARFVAMEQIHATSEGARRW